tara:strand:- start:865 stop:1080 length:216 start_codon:yes stop_codon:yes gene_type:complete
MRIFKKGDFVRIKDNTHHPNMPASRMGHLMIREPQFDGHRLTQNTVSEIWNIHMTNGRSLKIHQMFLEHVE